MQSLVLMHLHRKGQYFKLEMYKKVNKKKTEMVSIQEAYWQLKKICDQADAWEKGIHCLANMKCGKYSTVL